MHRGDTQVVRGEMSPGVECGQRRRSKLAWVFVLSGFEVMRAPEFLLDSHSSSMSFPAEMTHCLDAPFLIHVNLIS